MSAPSIVKPAPVAGSWGKQKSWSPALKPVAAASSAGAGSGAGGGVDRKLELSPAAASAAASDAGANADLARLYAMFSQLDSAVIASVYYQNCNSDLSAAVEHLLLETTRTGNSTFGVTSADVPIVFAQSMIAESHARATAAAAAAATAAASKSNASGVVTSIVASTSNGDRKSAPAKSHSGRAAAAAVGVTAQKHSALSALIATHVRSASQSPTRKPHHTPKHSTTSANAAVVIAPASAVSGGVTLAVLPVDAIERVMEYLDVFGLGRVSRTCRELYVTVQPFFDKQNRLSPPALRGGDMAILQMIARFPNLQILNLRRCTEFERFDALASVCQRTSTLKQLVLTGCEKLYDSDMPCICVFMPNIEVLDLSRTWIGDESLECVAKLTQLKSLTINGCTSVTANGIGRLMDRSVSLQTLEMRDLPFYGDTLPFNHRPDVSSPPTLHTITLSNIKVLHNFRLPAPNTGVAAAASVAALAPAAMAAAANPNPNPHPNANAAESASVSAAAATAAAAFRKYCVLSTLNLPHNWNLQSVRLDVPTLTALNLSSCKCLHTLSINLPLLETLNLSGCAALATVRGIPDSASISGRPGSGRLIALNVQSCRSIKPEVILNWITGSGKTLQTLVLTACIQLSNVHATAILQSCDRLSLIDVAGCKFIEPPLVGLLQKHAERLTRARAKRDAELKLNKTIKISTAALTAAATPTTKSASITIGRSSSAAGDVKSSPATAASLDSSPSLAAATPTAADDDSIPFTSAGSPEFDWMSRRLQQLERRLSAESDAKYSPILNPLSSPPAAAMRPVISLATPATPLPATTTAAAVDGEATTTTAAARSLSFTPSK